METSTYFPKNAYQEDYLDVPQRINLNSAWFKHRKAYETDLRIYQFQKILFPLLGGFCVLVPLLIFKKEAKFQPVDFILAPTLALISSVAFFLFIINCSKLGGVPNLSHEKNLKILCYKIENLSLKAFCKNYKELKKTFKTCVRYKVIPYNIFHNMNYLRKDFRCLLASAESRPAKKEKKAELQQKWDQFRPEISQALPYQIEPA